MSKIYELDRSLFNKIQMYPTYDKFIFTEKYKEKVIVVDNTSGDFFTEDFSNKTKGLIYLVNDSFMPYDVEKEYRNNRHKYNNYHKVISDSVDYYMDNNLNDIDFLKFDPNKKYEFIIDLEQGKQKFKANIMVALGLSINYDRDLEFENTTIISPLTYDWDTNHDNIEKCVGTKNLCKRDNNFGWLIDYVDMNSPQIELIQEKTKDIKV